jgi:hypothetical protein
MVFGLKEHHSAIPQLPSRRQPQTFVLAYVMQVLTIDILVMQSRAMLITAHIKKNNNNKFQKTAFRWNTNF